LVPDEMIELASGDYLGMRARRRYLGESELRQTVALLVRTSNQR
jgi:hypothetical protein